jgi:hypothetical protein
MTVRIVLEFKDVAGGTHSETAVGYVEGGYCGNAEATVVRGGKVIKKQHINMELA